VPELISMEPIRCSDCGKLHFRIEHHKKQVHLRLDTKVQNNSLISARNIEDGRTRIEIKCPKCRNIKVYLI
jgi:phage FluMu protein Com